MTTTAERFQVVSHKKYYLTYNRCVLCRDVVVLSTCVGEQFRVNSRVVYGFTILLYVIIDVHYVNSI